MFRDRGIEAFIAGVATGGLLFSGIGEVALNALRPQKTEQKQYVERVYKDLTNTRLSKFGRVQVAISFCEPGLVNVDIEKRSGENNVHSDQIRITCFDGTPDGSLALVQLFNDGNHTLDGRTPSQFLHSPHGTLLTIDGYTKEGSSNQTLRASIHGNPDNFFGDDTFVFLDDFDGEFTVRTQQYIDPNDPNVALFSSMYDRI